MGLAYAEIGEREIGSWEGSYSWVSTIQSNVGRSS
jgi:hypothetical protein